MKLMSQIGFKTRSNTTTTTTTAAANNNNNNNNNVEFLYTASWYSGNPDIFSVVGNSLKPRISGFNTIQGM
jgi:hypothetical protein